MAYQTNGFRFGHGFPVTLWVKRLLLANVAFWLSLTVFGDLQEWLSFAAADVLRKPWSPLSYMFVHMSFGHLFMNMLVLFFFGPPLESRWGSRFFIKYYLITGLSGALFSALLYPWVGAIPIIGASGAIFGLLVAFAMNWPNSKIYLYFLFPVPAKWVVVGLGLFSLFSTVSGVDDGVAHWAHLGGLITGFMYLRFGERVGRILGKVLFKEVSRPVKVELTGNEKTKTVKSSARRWRQGGDVDSLDEIDRILDKIQKTGMGSLTTKERSFLDEMSRQYKKTRMH
jgi:membrane associated rhomboid family serine protease